MSARIMSFVWVCLAGCSLAAPSEKAQSAPEPMARDELDSSEGKVGRRELGAAAGAAPAAPAVDAPGRPMAQMLAKKERALSSLDKLAAANEATGMDVTAELAVDGEAAPQAPTRSWFPESFLFEPRVVTDASGRAVVDVRVPDRLTTWRVLALAHTRSGEQAGALTKFLGTLPVYVEPVVPRQLVSGDVVRVPIQLVNTTEAPVTRTLRLSIEGGALDGSASRAVTIPASGSAVELATLRATAPGALLLRAELAGADAIERSITVIPRGRRVIVERAGTLAAPRSLAIEAPAGESSAAKLTVFPGALALLRSELSSAGGRGGAADDAYALLLAGEAPALLAKLGGEADAEALRTLRILATQRALRHARVPQLEVATLLAEAALAHPGSPVLERLGERLLAQLAGFQRPDGTYGGQTGWTLQRLLAGTGESVHAMSAAAARSERDKTRAEAARLRASAAVERNLGRVEDAYTASVLVASGAAQGSVAEQLRKTIVAAVVRADDGTRSLPVPSGVVRVDGVPPSEVELAAVAALALAGDPEAKPIVAELASAVLASYRPGFGFGDGRANLWCLRAILATFTEPLPSAVAVTLALGDAEIASGRFDAARLRDVIGLGGPIPKAKPDARWSIRAEPAIPGLGYRLELTTWVPWTAEPEEGVSLEVEAPSAPRVGRAAEITLVAGAPSGFTGELVHRLPAGVVPDRPSLDALVQAGTLSSYDTEDGAVRMRVPPLAPATPWRASYKVVPTLAGTLSSGESTLAMAGVLRVAPPKSWTIAP